MSSATSGPREPCSNCRASHQKCDKRKPTCKRCENKGLECKPVQRKAIFRHGSTANFDASFGRGQTWVNSKPRNWRPSVHASSLHGSSCAPAPSLIDTSGTEDLVPEEEPLATGNLHRQEPPASHSGHHGPSQAYVCPFTDHILDNSPHGSSVLTLSSPSSWTSCNETQVPSQAIHQQEDRESIQKNSTHDTGNSRVSGRNSAHRTTSSDQLVRIAFGTVQESCLLRYFVEELSPWFDHCDDRRHFQLVVPRRAQHCPSLRNALFAVAARRMCRLPKYKTPQGILYHGQLLPDLKESSALEYMLRCIPDLVQFPDIQDPIHQENIMAATVILRQYEEMEEEMGDGETDADIYTDERVKFLAITQTIIDSMMASPLDYSNYSLANAAYWIVIRQEIYYALARESVPHLRFDSDRWRNASIPNNVIMFAGEVATWRWGQKLPDEWARLKVKEQQLTQDCQGELDPILEIKADRCRGQIFPVVWYSFDVQVTAIQHFQLARMILIAENPNLEHASRTAHRKAEAQVRSIVLNLCGIAVHHLRVQPALLNAVIAITLYGEYFTNQEERDALIGIIDQTKDIHIWPMRKPYQTLQRRWEVLDSADL